TTLDSTNASIQKNTDYAAELRVEGSHVRFIVDDIEVGNVTFTGEDLTDGKLGLSAVNSRMQVDNFEVKEILPSPEATDDAVATLVNTPITIAVLANDTHETQGTAIEIKSATAGAHGTVVLVDSNQDGKNDSITYTPGTDYRGVDTFEYIVTDAADQTDRGSVIVVTAGPLPIADDFSDNLAQDFLFDNSQWQVSGERFTAIAREGNFAGVLIGEPLPANVEFNATVNIQSVNGFNRNGYFVFDYTDESNYKYIGANENSRRWEVAEVSGGMTLVHKSLRETIRMGQDYQLQLLIEGSTVTLNVDGTEMLTHQFDENVNAGGLALYSNKSRTHFDNVEVKEYVVLPVANDDRVSTKVDTQVTIGILANDYAPNGSLEVTAFTQPNNATAALVDTNNDGDLDSVLFTPTQGFEGVTTFTYDIRDPKGFTDSATVTVSVADTLSYTEDFNDGAADDFAAVAGTWQVIDSQYSLNAQNADGISVLTLAEDVPEDFEIGVTMNVSSISGFAKNAFIVFDYISEDDFKFAGALVGGSGRWTIGEYVNGSRRFLTKSGGQMATDTDLAISLLYQGNTATLKSDGDSVLEWQFNDAGNDGKFGLLAINAQVDFDDFYAKAVDAAMGE
ncbi:MAG: Ig-like domain-containing protein, partial [Pirellulaceae bacterium]|nr:Ig-like domain-containing protein [Pirellulaceae bacterium]